MRGFVFVGMIITGLATTISLAFAGGIIGSFTVSEETSPLTNLTNITASVDSTSDLFTRSGKPKKASFVIRCRDNVLSTFVTWPEIISPTYDDRTTVLYKVDNQLIKTDYWKLAKGRRAAGGFDNDETMKILNSINSENRLIVRIKGQLEQDAVFEISGIGQIIAKAQSACGLDVNALPSAMPLGFPDNPGASTPVDRPVAQILGVAKDVLESAGYNIAKRDEAAGVLSTGALDVPLSTKMANCGKLMGFSYLSDKRAKTAVAYFVTYSSGALTVKVAINGLYMAGYGNPNMPLTCASTGQLEKVMLQNIMAKL